MKIESILRRPGGTFVTLDAVRIIDGEEFKGTKTYHFEPQEDGREIAEVINEEHIGLFLGIREGYRVAKGVETAASAPPPPPPPPPVTAPPPPAENPAPATDPQANAGSQEGEQEDEQSASENDGHSDDLHLHHVGRGRWAVFDGSERKTGSMTKEEAQAELDKLIAAASQEG